MLSAVTMRALLNTSSVPEPRLCLGGVQAAPGPISTVRVATASRTARSWKMPTIAAPRWRAASISSMTASRFVASSAAVGSSSSRIGCSAINPRAILTRCCSPPEKVAGGKLHNRARNGEAVEQPLSALARRRGVDTEPAQRLGNQVERRDARDHSQELADEAQRPPAHVEHEGGRRGSHVHHAPGMPDQDVPLLH